MRSVLLAALPIVLMVSAAAYLLRVGLTAAPLSAKARAEAAAKANDEPASMAADRAVGEHGDKAPAGKHRRMLVFPDGSELPPLNGVRFPAKVEWSGNTPYSPVVGTKTIEGQDFYVHADGSYTTTVRTWRKDLGRWDSATVVFNVDKSIKPQPMLPGISHQAKKGPTRQASAAKPGRKAPGTVRVHKGAASGKR